MRKIINIMALLVVLMFFHACQEYEMIKYDKNAEINFFGYFYAYEGSKPYPSDDPKYLKWEKNFGINKLGDSLLVDTMTIGVKIMGVYADHPRRVVLKAKPVTDDGLEVIFPEEYYLPADTGVAEFKVVVKRPAKRNLVYKADLEFDYVHSDFNAGTKERQVYRLECRDVVTMELWGTNEEEWNAEESYGFYLGDWSEVKARFIITTLGCVSISKWSNSDDFYDDILFNLPLAFEEYKSNPDNPPLLDERTGEWITFPVFE